MMQEVHRLTGLTPADGVPTIARRLIDKSGTSIGSDEAHKYIRVIGSRLSNLEPHFWGDGAAIAKLPNHRRQADHYYVTNVLERIEITVKKISKVEKDAIRTDLFDYTSGLSKCLDRTAVTPWDTIPDRYGRAKYLMWLAQTRADELRAVGFDEKQIDRCARRGVIGEIIRGTEKVTFDVHHRVPLQVGGSNAIKNLCLVESKVHNPFFHKGDDPMLNRMKKGKELKVALTVPRDDIHIIAKGYNVREIVSARR